MSQSKLNKAKIALSVVISLLILSTFFFCTMWLLERKGAEGIKTELEWIHVSYVDEMAQLTVQNVWLQKQCGELPNIK